MGLISSLAAPSGPQIHTLAVRPVQRIAAQGGPGLDAQTAAQHTAQALGGAELPAEANLRPVLAPAASEAIFKGLLPVQTALQEVAEDGGALIETQTEVDGISLDGIPYLNDGAVLLDDLPQTPTAAPVKSPPPEVSGAMAPVMAQPMRPEVEVQAAPEQVKTEQAERAYQDEREISALPGDAPAEAAQHGAAQNGAAQPKSVQHEVKEDSADPEHVDTRA